MSTDADIHVNLFCPNCGNAIANVVRMQWGRVPRTSGYNIGDTVEWIESGNRVIEPFRYVRGGFFNVGTPDIANVLLLDTQDFWPPYDFKCSNCQYPIPAVGIIVRIGKIHEVRVLSPEDLEELATRRPTMLDSIYEWDKSANRWKSIDQGDVPLQPYRS